MLIPAVLVATIGLAYYGYSYSLRIAEEVRAANQATKRELAEEKVIGIQTAIIEADRAFFEAAELDRLSNLKELLARSPHRSVLVLDLGFEIVPGGFHTKRQDDEAITEFRTLFLEEILPDLELEEVLLQQRRHLHAQYGGWPYLLSYTRLFSQGKMYFVVLEVDLSYLLAAVFPEFLDVRGPNLYQVVDRDGSLVYGYAFTGIPESEVVELSFPKTLSRWRLRIAQKDAGSLASRATRQQTVDLVLIGLAMAVIVAGLAVLVLAMRRERRLSELKSDFISNVSHELKTPLSIISMFGEMLAMGRARSTDQAAEYAEIIRRESVRLSRLIDNVLDFAKIERGVDVYEFADEEDFAAVLERALEISDHRFDRAEMELTVDIEPDLPPVRMDANAMTLAILNLVDNAIKYAAAGGRLEIALRRRGDGIELEVRDFGPGIDPDEKEDVFERFYRARSVRLAPIRGSGIGLALVKHIAEGHGGRIEVDTALGQGCAFRLWIPAGSEG